MDILMEITVYYSIFLMFFGLLGNLFSLIICLQKQMRAVPTFVFYSFALVADTLSLYFWNADHVSFYWYNVFLEDLSLDLCKSLSFIQIFSFQFGAWLLVGMTMERYLSTMVKTWRSSIFKSKHALITSCVIGLVLFIMNISFMSTIEGTNTSDTSFNVSCFSTNGLETWLKAQNFMFCFIPFGIMLVTNCLLIYRIKISKKHAIIQKNDKSKTTLLVLLVTSLFLIASSPTAILNAFFLEEFFTMHNGMLYIFITDNIIFTFNSANIFILYFSNKKFAIELKSLFLKIIDKKRSNKVSDTRLVTSTKPKQLTTNVSHGQESVTEEPRY